ncbi:cellulase family glycosylhydrolase [Novosphingobium sp.]|uniref:cellulase family glycosylhydrolase n=1 Tax=Novosphingobium sp. TaxID=1874826 RepID=UPI00333F6E31
MKPPTIILHAALVVAAIAGFGPAVASPPSLDPGQITLTGTTLRRDGHPWIMRGVKLTSRLVPPRVIHRPIIGPHLRESQTLWSADLPLRIRQFGADTAAIEVSQPGLDPAHAIYDPDYRAEVIAAVMALRHAGLTVMISMQWENGAGAPRQPDTPGPGTQNAWHALLSPAPDGVALPSDDAGLIFDVFNEPMPMPVYVADIPADRWAQWQAAHAPVIATIRAAGFHRQVVVVGGIDGAHRLDHAPMVPDPDHRMVYGVHPYLTANMLQFETAAGRDRYFGDFCRHNACMITEFALSRRPDERPTGCKGDAPAVVHDLLAYAWDRHLGMVGWAFDYPWTLMAGPDFTTPTTFDAWAGSCAASTAPYGFGQMLRDWYHRHG